MDLRNEDDDIPKLVPDTRIHGLILRMLHAVAPRLATQLAIQAFTSTRVPRSGPALRPGNARPLDIDFPEIGNLYIWGSSGPWVLLVHEWRQNSSTLYPLANRLAQAGYRVVTFDVSAAGATYGANSISIAKFSEITALLCRKLGKTHLVVAHGLGGIASVSAATREVEPDRMVLLSTPCDLSVVLERWASQRGLPSSLTRRMHHRLEQSADSALVNWDLRKQGCSLFCPVLVIHGERDSLVPKSETDRLVRALPRATARIEAGLDHNEILTDKRVQEVILAFARCELVPRTKRIPVESP